MKDPSKAAEKIGAALDELEFLLAEPPRTVGSLYDAVAEHYDDFRAVWLAPAGKGAERALLDDLRATLEPGQRVLDVGSGNGAVARQIKAIEPGAEIAMLDLSPAMLSHALDVPGTHVVGNVLALPFPDNYFDAVVSAWVIETVADPIKAVSEYLRVIACEGNVFYTFCSLPEGWLSRAGTTWLRSIVTSRLAGEFLSSERTPWHDCHRSHKATFRGGLVSEIALGKCCAVTGEIAPPGSNGQAGSVSVFSMSGESSLPWASS